jgi:iron complex outermembrane receptor protein
MIQMASRKAVLLSCAAAAACFAMPLSARAAAAATAAAGGSGAAVTEIEELVVTAEKREQSLQDVPVAITAFTSTKRDLIGIDTIQDITNFTPGLSYSTGTDRISLRGIGRFTNNLASEGGVANYSDGFYTSSTVEAGKTPIFVDRVEVLRGPQGTLYGRNSIGGAINTISRHPTKDFYAEVRANIGNYNYSLFEAAVSGPVNDHLRLRLAGNKLDQDKGYFHNTSPVGGSSEGNGLDQWYVEGQAEGDLFDDKVEWWTKVAGAGWDNNSGGPGGRSGALLGVYDNFNVITNGGLVPNAMFGFTPNGEPANTDLRSYRSNIQGKVKLQQNLIWSGHLTVHMDGFDVKYIGGYQHYLYRLHTDVDNSDRLPFPFAANPAVTIFPNVVNDYTEDNWWFSNEINIASSGDGPLSWIVGGYQYKETRHYEPINAKYPDQPQFRNPLVRLPGSTALTAAAPDPQGSYAINRDDGTSESYAVFGQADYRFADRFTAHLGLRYTYDRKKSFESDRLLCFGVPGVCAAATVTTPAIDVSQTFAFGQPAAGQPLDPSVVVNSYYNPADGFVHRQLKNHWDAVTGTAGLDWKPDADTLAYGKYTRGYKAGGFNAGSLQVYPTTDSETIDAFEVGLKKTFGGRFQANASLFYYDYKNIQAPLTGIGASGLTITQFFNIPKSTSKGFELETIWAPIDNLQILANYAYLDAKIKDGCCFQDGQDPLALQPGAVRGPTQTSATSILQDVSGATLPSSPKNRVTLNANYTWRFEPGALTASISYIWRDETYYGIFNRYYNHAKAWDQTDLRLSYVDAKDRYTVILYGKNVFDRLGFDGSSGTRLSNGLVNQTINLTPPRTYGLELQYRF